jgi:hypothetical protein
MSDKKQKSLEQEMTDKRWAAVMQSVSTRRSST